MVLISQLAFFDCSARQKSYRPQNWLTLFLHNKYQRLGNYCLSLLLDSILKGHLRQKKLSTNRSKVEKLSFLKSKRASQKASRILSNSRPI